MDEGKTYKVDLSSKDFDTFLRIEDDGETLAFNDNRNPKDTNSLLYFKAPKSGSYRIVVTTSKGEQTGDYKLLVTEPTHVESIALNVKDFGKLDGAEHTRRSKNSPAI